MKRSTIAKRKLKGRTGRPPTGAQPMIGLRLSPAKRREVEQWASRQDDEPKFSEAVRRLLDMGLKVLP